MSSGVQQPRVPWGGPKGAQKGPATGNEAAARALRGALILTNPTAAVLTAAMVLGLTRPALMRRLRGWWVSAAGVVLLVVGSLLGWGRLYVQPYRDLAAAVGHSVAGGAAARPDAGGVLATVEDRWLAWVLGQVPIGFAFAAIIAGVVLARRRRYVAGWRVEDKAADWSDLSARQIAAGHREVSKAAAATPSQAFADLSMPLGIDARGRVVSLMGRMLISHMVVTGPSGNGKTTTLLRIMWGWCVLWAARRLPLVLFDFKADVELRADIEAIAAATGRRVHVVSVTGPSTTYNPIRHGSSEEVASRLIETLANADGGGFESPHHRSVGERWLNVAVAVLDAVVAAQAPGWRRTQDGQPEPWQRTLQDLAVLMPFTTLRGELGALSGDVRARARRLVDEVETEKDLLRSISGMTQRVALLTETAAGRVALERPDGLDLEQVIRQGDIALFSLSTQANSAAARAIGNLAIADLSAVLDRLGDERWSKTEDRRVLVVLDEFGGLGGSLLSGLLQRARSAGASLIVSSQTDGGFTSVSPEFAEDVWGNSNVWILHRQVADSASARAEALGTTSGWAETLQVTEDTDVLGATSAGSGVGSLRKVERFTVHPNELKKLDVGQIIFASWSPHFIGRVRVTEVPPLPHAGAGWQVSPVSPPAMSAPAASVEATEPANVSGRGWTHEVDW